MLSNSKKSGNWQKTLSLINQCPICSQDYDEKATKLFMDRQNTHLVHITCGNCKSYFVAMIMELGKALSTVGMITDLSFVDIERLHIKDSISLDEAITGYELIEGKNFTKLLTKNN